MERRRKQHSGRERDVTVGVKPTKRSVRWRLTGDGSEAPAQRPDAQGFIHDLNTRLEHKGLRRDATAIKSMKDQADDQAHNRPDTTAAYAAKFRPSGTSKPTSSLAGGPCVPPLCEKATQQISGRRRRNECHDTTAAHQGVVRCCIPAWLWRAAGSTEHKPAHDASDDTCNG